MARLEWDLDMERLFQTGIKNCVLYVRDSNGTYSKGVPWNGITGITESPSGAETISLYGSDGKYLNLISNEDFNASITAYTYPDEFEECDGSYIVSDNFYVGQQTRKTFGLCYKTTIGNDTEGLDYGYILHLIYGATASPSERAYVTVNESPEAIDFSWDISTIPVNANGMWTSNINIDSTKVDAASFYMLEQILYGTDWTNARLPLPEELISFMSEKHEKDWLGGIFPLFDDIAYPYSGSYEEITTGFYPKIDERKF